MGITSRRSKEEIRSMSKQEFMREAVFSDIVKDCGKGITVQMVRDAFIRFKKLDFLIWEAGKSRTDGIKVTILNWNNYQAEEYL